jgi:hypothetical protein
VKRAAIKRSSPLQRHKRIRRGPSRRTLNRKLAEALYLRWLHGRECVVRGSSYCAGLIQQSHARNIDGPTGIGRKESDFNSVPKCARHHAQWEAHAGAFAGWSKEARRRWMKAAIAVEHMEFKLAGGVIP